MKKSFLSYIAVIVLLLLLADAWGVAHAFRMHGNKDGTIALVLPPYGLYRAGESIMHPKKLTAEEAAEMAKSAEGREALRGRLRLKDDVWKTMLDLIAQQVNSRIMTELNEGETIYNVTATAIANGPAKLKVTAKGSDDVTVEMVDADRDQEPETLTITRMVNGKPDVHETPIAKFDFEESSQFLFVWSLAWGTIAEGLQAQ